MESKEIIVIAEGYATARSIAESIDFCVIAAMSSCNLKSVTVKFSEQFKNSKIIIAADDDEAGRGVAGNAQEGVAEKHNDSLLVLDEIGQADNKDIQQTVYMIGNEKGKSRMTVDATLKKIKSWRLLCFSSGEVGIGEKIEAAGQGVHGGVLVRCIDIEAQSSKGIGIFEDLRGCSNGNEFSTTLTERTSKYYETAAKFFIEGIRKTEECTIRNIFDEALGRIKSALQLENIKDGATSRVINSFALINTAGILASSDYIGVLNHNSMAIDCAATVLTQYL